MLEQQQLLEAPRGNLPCIELLWLPELHKRCKWVDKIGDPKLRTWSSFARLSYRSYRKIRSVRVEWPPAMKVPPSGISSKSIYEWCAAVRWDMCRAEPGKIESSLTPGPKQAKPIANMQRTSWAESKCKSRYRLKNLIQCLKVQVTP